MTFRVGQKVVCVKAFDPASRPEALGAKAIFKGDIYTVRSIESDFGEELFLLMEIHNPLHFSGLEYGYCATRFRPVQEQGMSILRAIAANPNQKIREDA